MAINKNIITKQNKFLKKGRKENLGLLTYQHWMLLFCNHALDLLCMR